MLASDHWPHCMTGPLVLVKAATNTMMSGNMDSRITKPTPPVYSAAVHERTRTAAGARPCVMV
ncbi:hypothetical protein D3C81_1883860 [compost metagenome]